MTCKDCIHYDVCYHIEHYGRHIETEEPCGGFKNKVDFVEMKHGSWYKSQLVQKSGFRTVKDFLCNRCEKEYSVQQPSNLMNYCPYCGAKMDGGNL